MLRLRKTNLVCPSFHSGIQLLLLLCLCWFVCPLAATELMSNLCLSHSPWERSVCKVAPVVIGGVCAVRCRPGLVMLMFGRVLSSLVLLHLRNRCTQAGAVAPWEHGCGRFVGRVSLVFLLLWCRVRLLGKPPFPPSGGGEHLSPASLGK